MSAITTVDRIGSPLLAISVLDVCTALAVSVGDATRAARWHGVAENGYASAGMQRDAADSAFLAGFLQAGRGAIGSQFDAGVEAGRAQAHAAVWQELPAWLASITGSRRMDPAA